MRRVREAVGMPSNLLNAERWCLPYGCCRRFTRSGRLRKRAIVVDLVRSHLLPAHTLRRRPLWWIPRNRAAYRLLHIGRSEQLRADVFLKVFRFRILWARCVTEQESRM